MAGRCADVVSRWTCRRAGRPTRAGPAVGTAEEVVEAARTATPSATSAAVAAISATRADSGAADTGPDLVVVIVVVALDHDPTRVADPAIVLRDAAAIVLRDAAAIARPTIASGIAVDRPLVVAVDHGIAPVPSREIAQHRRITEVGRRLKIAHVTIARRPRIAIARRPRIAIARPPRIAIARPPRIAIAQPPRMGIASYRKIVMLVNEDRPVPMRERRSPRATATTMRRMAVGHGLVHWRTDRLVKDGAAVCFAGGARHSRDDPFLILFIHYPCRLYMCARTYLLFSYCTYISRDNPVFFSDCRFPINLDLHIETSLTLKRFHFY